MPDRRKYTDRAEYLKKQLRFVVKTIRAKLIEYKDGQCMLCGYSRCIDVLDLRQKDLAFPHVT